MGLILRYLEFAPPPGLRSLVASAWCLSGDGKGSADPQPIVPDGCVEIVINLADPFRRVGPSGSPERQSSALVAGQMTGPTLVIPGGRIELLGIRFEPWGAAHLVGVPVRELRDRIVPLEYLAPDLARDLPSLPDERRKRSDRIEALFEACERKVSRASEPSDPAARAMVEEIRATPGPLSVRALERHVGLPPRLLHRIWRLQRALGLLLSERRASLTTIAHRCGYYDHAHFTHEFRRLAGCSPTEFLGRERAVTDPFIGR